MYGTVNIAEDITTEIHREISWPAQTTVKTRQGMKKHSKPNHANSLKAVYYLLSRGHIHS